MNITTVFGNFILTEPFLIDLISSAAVQRMKRLQQGGITPYVKDIPSYTRYDHSLGVFALLRRYGCSLTEQVAGLLHDVSHTAFSHVADFLFTDSERKDSYQDSIHKWFIEQTDLAEIIARHGYAVDDFLHKEHPFPALEQELPHLCADRIDYTLQHAVVEGRLEQWELEAILDHLHFDGARWYFDDPLPAQAYVTISFQIIERCYTDWNVFLYLLTARLLKRALLLGVVTSEQLHFGTDDELWQLLQEADDEQMQQTLGKMKKFEHSFLPGSQKDYDLFYVTKFRGVDPWVLGPGGFQRLTVLDPVYAKVFQETNDEVKQGCYLKEC